MTDAPSFDDFVRTRSTQLLRLAYLLTRDHSHAEDLLQTTLARSWSVWRRIDADPEPYVKRVLVNTYSSWRGRRWHGELPSVALPEMATTAPQTEIDNRDQVWRALGRLAHQQRAVLVLRYFEDLTELQIADALGISTGTVKSHASKGLANLRIDETLRPFDVQVPVAPPGTERLAGVHARIRARRVRRVAATTVAALILVLAVLAAPHLHLRSDTYPTNLKVGDYDNGRLIVATAQGPVDQVLSLTFTPHADSERVAVGCTADLKYTDWMVLITADGVNLGGTDCDPRRGSYTLGYGSPVFHPGVPVTMTLRVIPASEFRALTAATTLPDPPTRQGMLSLTIGEPVPFDSYPLPPRPQHLAALPSPDPSGLPDDVVGIRPGCPQTVSLPSGQYDVYIHAQTPGFIHITAGGTTTTAEFWDYSGNGQLVGVTIGNSGQNYVSVTVTAEHMTGDWYAEMVLHNHEILSNAGGPSC